MFRRIQRFAQSPIGRRVVMWLAPIVVGWVMSKLQGKSTTETTTKKGRKTVKNKAK